MSVAKEIAKVLFVVHEYHDKLARGAEQPLTAQAVLDTKQAYDALVRAVHALAFDAVKYRQLRTPEIVDFLAAVEREALHQRDIHSHKGDAGKTDTDWFFLLGYLGGKAVHAGAVADRLDPLADTGPHDHYAEKRLHHIVTTAAACLNWHAARVGTYRDMRPGIEEEKRQCE